MDVHLIAAVSLDGYIAKDDSDDLSWSGRADKEWFKQKTLASGVVIMGATQYGILAQVGLLKDRFHVVYTQNPQNFQNQENVFFTDMKPQQLLKDSRLSDYTDVCIIGGSQIFSLFLKEKVITDMWITLCPIVLGNGVKLLSEIPPQINLSLEDTTTLDQSTLRLHYKVVY